MPKSAKSHPPLLLLVCLFLLFYTGALSLASGTRTHNEALLINWHYFLPYALWLFGTLAIQRNINQKLPNRDPWVFPFTAALTGLGILTIWRLSPDLGLKQALWYLVGTVLFILALNIPDLINSLKNYKYVWLFLGFILIGLTFLVGVNPAGVGQKLWLRIFDLYIQPSEPLKLLLIIYLAGFFADQIKPNISWIASVFPTLVIILFAGLLLIAQRDLGTATIFVSLYVLMITVTTQKRRLLYILPALAILGGTIGYFVFDVVRTRVDIWLNPWVQASGNAWQLTQAQIAIAAGGLTGTGPGLGSPQFVPIAVSDFIFTSIAEELGLLGTAAVILMLLFIILRGISIALSSKTTFGRYLAFGISAYLALQSIFIIAGNLGLFPLTGITLPYLSYGGSSLVTNLLSLMILLKVSTLTSSKTQPETVLRPYRWVTGFIAIIFALMAIWNGYLAFPKQQELISKAENQRWSVYDRYSPRGEIYALSGEKLVETRLGATTGSYDRRITVPDLSNTIGYAHAGYGQTGIEKSQYALLRGYAGIDWETIKMHEWLYNQPPPGLNIKLNINLTLQNKADALLGDHKGAIVLVNAQTGEIYAIASHPSFDANKLPQIWEELSTQTDAPLLNRATQGMYPIGSLANTLALGSFMTSENLLEQKSPLDLTRLDPFCYQAMQSAEQGLNTLQFGCISTSESILNTSDPEIFLRDLANFGLFSSPDLAIQTAQPAIAPTLEELDFDPTIVMDIPVSPLQMAMVAATITGDGIKPTPALVNSYQTPEGKWQALGDSGITTEVLPGSVTRAIQTELASTKHSIWYQLGHAMLEEEQALTWYIGGTTPDWPATPLAIAIALEENAPDLVQSIGGALLTLSVGE